MTSIKRDDNKQKWEQQTDFPLVCETCLGDNPYVRMTKEPFGKACKICERPFTVFAWQAGTRGRLKKVEICRDCALSKNVCQVCIYDLQYGLPVQLRDKVLSEEGGGGGTASSSSVVPQSDANLSWYTAQQKRAIEQGVSGTNPSAAAHLKLQSMARMEPRYERNLPKLCSFFAKGECNRGSKCPFRHEAPRDRNDPLSKQNTKDRFYGTNDPVAAKMFGRRKEREEKIRKEEEEDGGDDERGDERAVSTIYVRFADTTGEGASENTGDDVAKVSEMDMRDEFYSFGEITSLRMHKHVGAFIEYSNEESAQLALSAKNCTQLNGRLIYVNWARQPKRGAISGPSAASAAATSSSNSSHGVIRPAPPPGSIDNNKSVLPPGLRPVRPPPEVKAAAAAAAARSAGGKSSVGVPRPGGGVIRQGGRISAVPKPYYPSSDPSRLGSKASVTGGDS